MLLLPSEIEGFGLPALEAYYLSTPLVYVRGSTPVEEILGERSPPAFVLASADSIFVAAVDQALGLDATLGGGQGGWTARPLRLEALRGAYAQRRTAVCAESPP